MTTTPFYPMRPKTRIPPLDRYTGPIPEGWDWQAKIDDERGIVRVPAEPVTEYELFNRHWEPIAAHKAKVFDAAIRKLVGLFPDERLFDVALLGFRGHWTPGAVVLLDIPGEEPWEARREKWIHMWIHMSPRGAVYWDPIREPFDRTPGEVYVLASRNVGMDRRHVVEFFMDTKDKPGIEGLIGRDPEAPYQCGDSDRMVKCRWK